METITLSLRFCEAIYDLYYESRNTRTRALLIRHVKDQGVSFKLARAVIYYLLYSNLKHGLIVSDSGDYHYTFTIQHSEVNK